MGLVKDIDLGIGDQLGKAGVFDHQIGKKQMVIDDQQLGIQRLAPGLDQVAVIIAWTIAPQTVVVSAGHMGQDGGLLQQIGDLGHIAASTVDGEGLNPHQIGQHLGFLQVRGHQQLIEPM